MTGWPRQRTGTQSGGLRGTWRSLLSVVLESPCPLCHRSTPDILCGGCQRKLQQEQAAVWVPGSPPILAWGAYGGELKRAIAALKYENQPQLARLLGQWLAQAWLDCPTRDRSQSPWVVPIPLHPTRLQERGFNQAERLAEPFCAIAGLRLMAHGLVRSKATIAQFQLNPQERSRNLTQAFQVHPHLQRHPPSHPILLVDDIYTTGTTIREAVHTFRRQGIRVSGVVVLAQAAAVGNV